RPVADTGPALAQPSRIAPPGPPELRHELARAGSIVQGAKLLLQAGEPLDEALRAAVGEAGGEELASVAQPLAVLAQLVQRGDGQLGDVLAIAPHPLQSALERRGGEGGGLLREYSRVAGPFPR